VTLRRIELLQVADAAPAGAVTGLENALRNAADHCPIRRVRLARSATQRHGWTHVWEQEYADAASLEAYMRDPYHWSVIDPFFDATSPTAIVERVTVLTYDDSDAAGPTHWPDEGLRRLLLIRCAPGADPRAIDELRDAITAGGTQLPLAGWRLARALPHPTHPWSLIWEQLFAGEDALSEYMRHPYHWTVIDPYFDPEHPMAIVSDVTMAYYRLPVASAA
jgi:hypothetical protein